MLMLFSVLLFFTVVFIVVVANDDNVAVVVLDNNDDDDDDDDFDGVGSTVVVLVENKAFALWSAIVLLGFCCFLMLFRTKFYILLHPR